MYGSLVQNLLYQRDEKNFQRPAFTKDTSTVPGTGLSYNLQAKLDIHGQGTVIANCTAPMRLLFTFSMDPDDTTQPQWALYVPVTENSIEFWHGPAAPAGSTGFLPGAHDLVLIKGEKVNDADAFLRPGVKYPGGSRYWMSVDSRNGVLRFGRDYTNVGLTLFEAILKDQVAAAPWRGEKMRARPFDSLSLFATYRAEL